MIERARQLRQESTPTEKALWELVRNRQCHGHKIQRQVPAGHFVLDFYCAAARLAIELDGGIHELPEVRQRDEERETVLREELQINVLRVSNEEILCSSPSALLARLDEAIRVAQTSVPPPNQRPARRQKL